MCCITSFLIAKVNSRRPFIPENSHNFFSSQFTAKTTCNNHYLMHQSCQKILLQHQLCYITKKKTMLPIRQPIFENLGIIIYFHISNWEHYTLLLCNNGFICNIIFLETSQQRIQTIIHSRPKIQSSINLCFSNPY